jgi:hypothetical protein
MCYTPISLEAYTEQKVSSDGFRGISPATLSITRQNFLQMVLDIKQARTLGGTIQE